MGGEHHSNLVADMELITRKSNYITITSKLLIKIITITITCRTDVILLLPYCRYNYLLAVI